MNKSSWWLLSILFLILVVTRVSNDYADSLYSFVGDYYYKKNNMQEFQDYYEKAFEKGLTASEKRSKYINSIINSPLTIDAQYKLLKFLDYPTEDVSKLKADFFLSDLKREIGKKYEKNFIKNTVYNQKVMRWGKLPISYGFENSENVPVYYVREIENAFTEWEKVTNNAILFEETKENPNITITFNENNPVGENSLKYIVAYTSPIVKTDSLENMQVEFYVKDPQGNNFSSNQVYNTALHEIAHALGFMGHSSNEDDVLFLTKDSASVSQDLREELSVGDINTIKLLYKIKPEITNFADVKAEYLPRLVLGDSEEVNSAKKREAKTYIQNAPEIEAGYIDLAEAYVAEKNYIKAIKNLEKALQLAKTDELKSMIAFNLAVSYHYVGNNVVAFDYLSQSIKTSDSDEKQYLLAEIYKAQNEIDKSAKVYKKLISANPENIEYVIALTNMYVQEKMYLKARKVLKEFIKNNPSQKNNPRFEPYGIIKMFL